MEYLRNKQTGEFKSVERDTPEFIALTAQVGPDNRPLWEQTGSQDVAATAARAAAGAVDETDLGSQDQPLAPVVVNTEKVGPAQAPWLELTAAEIEAGLTPDQKAKEVADDNIQANSEERANTLDEAAAKIDSSTPGFPVDPAESDAEGSASGSATRADLQEQARQRGLGTSGTKADLQARIAEYDRNEADQNTINEEQHQTA